jgi:hypothetical protein
LLRAVVEDGRGLGHVRPKYSGRNRRPKWKWRSCL